MDRHLAPFAHAMTWPQVERLVEEALVRFDPAAAEERRRDTRDHRHFDVHLDQVGFDGTAHVSGTLDAADALDLETSDRPPRPAAGPARLRGVPRRAPVDRGR